MEAVEIQISPRKLCPCGKSVLRMTSEEREVYDEAVRIIEERRLQDNPAGDDISTKIMSNGAELK